MANGNDLKNPTTIIIFGATGDLAQRKLLPALFDLNLKGFLPVHYQIVGFSRRELSDQDFQDLAAEAIKKDKHHHRQGVDDFLKHLTFQQGNFDQEASYQNLAAKLNEIDKKLNYCANKLFYLAVPPAMYEPIFEQLAKSGLASKCSNGEWTRVVVEKPFGKDIATAQKLDQKLGWLFKEEQIFRIDHYLAKETMQNILLFRFSNALFEPIWNSKYVERVEIRFFERIGIEGRGDFYHDVGALRDIGQNHVLQMLAAIAMEDPGRPAVNIIRAQRARALESLRPIKGSDVFQNVVRGQYQGFRQEKGVPTDSQTETFFWLKCYIDNQRWEGVPFYLTSGKKLKQSTVDIKIYFRKTICSICPPDWHEEFQNVLTFRVQPNEGISVLFWAKKPGLDLALEPTNLSFSYKDSLSTKIIPEAYQQVLLDCLKGDQMRFLSTQEVAAAWRFISPIIDDWQKIELVEYKPGSLGPKINH